MIRRSIIALTLLFSTPAFADQCQPFETAWKASEKIAAQGAELSKLNAVSANAALDYFRSNGVQIPIDWKPEAAIILHGKTVVVIAPRDE